MTGIPSRAAAAVAIFLFAFAAADRASATTTTADRLCGARPSDSTDSFPSDSTVVEAANVTEQRVRDARRGGSQLGSAITALELPSAGTAPPSPLAVARYCNAAGEVMRLSDQGSQLQAQTYLLTALRASRGAGELQLASQAAYRLGLVSVSGPQVGGARSGGARRARRSGTVITEDVREAQVETETCARLERARPGSSSNALLSTLALDCAARQARASGDPTLSALASLRLARLGLAWSESAADDPATVRQLALESAIEAVPVAAEAPDLGMRGELIGRLIDTIIDLGGAENPVVPAGLAAMREAQAGNPGVAGYAAALEARLALANGDAARARGLLEQAILMESQRPLPMRLPDYYLALAEADPAQRQNHVVAAYTALDNMRPLLPRTDPITEESIFALHMRRVFETAVEVQLAGASGMEEGARIRTAQRIVEDSRQAELLSAVGSECIPPRNPVQPEDLAAGEVLLYPLLLPDRVELLYVSGSDASGEVRYRRLEPNRSANRQTVTRLVEDLVLSMSYGDDEAWREPARRLYDILIRPIEGQLEPGSMLAIIPDGPLRALPFAALVSEDGRFLVQRTRLSVAPALAYSQPGESDGAGQRSVIAASLQQEVTLPAGYFAALVGTAGEANVAAENGRPGRHIVDFTKAQLVSALSTEPVDVLHLATHASFNGRSDRAFIVANGEAIRLSELRDIIARNRRRGEELDLLVLSACETAVGDDEASMGLAGAAVQAGATSAIASLWQVDDVGTSELMRQFYSRYREGRSRSAALRDAQLALLEGGGNNARPGIWAAFALLGAWR